MRRLLARTGLLSAVLLMLVSATTVAATTDADARSAALSQRYVTELGRHAPVCAGADVRRADPLSPTQIGTTRSRSGAGSGCIAFTADRS